MSGASSWRQDRVSTWTYVLLVALLIPFLFPLGCMFLSSLKTQVQNTAYPPVWLFTPTLGNYREVFQKNPFFTFTVNSMVVAAGSTGLALLLGLPGAYAIARFKRTGIALAILTHLIVALPLVLWVMIGFFEDVPGDLIEAARIDGCSHWAAFLRVALPLAKPGIVATGILSFIFSWNNFLFSLIIAGFKTRTLPIAVYSFLSYEEINWGGLTAAATVITLPVLLLALVVQKHIVRGLTFGALKG